MTCGYRTRSAVLMLAVGNVWRFTVAVDAFSRGLLGPSSMPVYHASLALGNRIPLALSGKTLTQMPVCAITGRGYP